MLNSPAMHRYTSLLLFHLIACETAVEVDVPRNPPQLTVNGLFNPDSVWQIELTQNRYALDNKPFASVPDAEVRVLQDGRAVAVLDYQRNASFTGNSIYRATEGRPELGKEYTLEVSHPTLGSLSANSQVPISQVDIVSVAWDTLDIRESSGPSGNSVLYGVTVQIDDPPERNFYSLSFFVRRNGLIYLDINGDNQEELVASPPLFFTPVVAQSDDPVVNNIFDGSRDELLFSDESFNGNQYALKLYMAEPIQVSGGTTAVDLFTERVTFGEAIYDAEGNILLEPGEPFGPGFTAFALLRTVTEEYYTYNYTRDLQASVENNPFAQPVQVFDNIENGLGIFAGYSQMEKEVAFR